MKAKKLRKTIVAIVLVGIIGVIAKCNIGALSPEDSRQQTDVQPGISDKPAVVFVPVSNADHGDSLEEVICGIRNEEYEHAVVFYGADKLCEVTCYSADEGRFSVGWPVDMNPSMILLHNHPLSGGYSFSYGDLNTLCDNPRFGTSIIVEDESVYMLTAPAGWPTVSELNEFLKMGFGLDFESPEGNINYTPHLDELAQDGYLLLSGKGFGFTSKLISEIADRFDLVYTVSEVSDFRSPVYAADKGFSNITYTIRYNMSGIVSGTIAEPE